ncbi:MAG: hypothetical protein Fur0028_16470 [Bacteroidales bacterium]
MEENKPICKAMTLTELAQRYGVSNKTLYSWLKRAHIIKNKREGYLFTPKEVKEIYDKLGEPEN